MSSKVTFPLNSDDIEKVLPHRYPFLLIDRVVSFNLQTYETLVTKNVTVNEACFSGHFPGKSVYPGVLILEGMAQASGMMFHLYLMHSDNGDDRSQSPEIYFMCVNDCKFRKPVIPGDQIEFYVTPERIKETIIKTKVVSKVAGEVVAESLLTSKFS